MIETNIEHLRDPFVLVDDKAYYVYGTGVFNNDWENTCWACYKNDSGKLNGEWIMTNELVYVRPQNAEKKLWAPEVHKYNGFYYMFATYHSSVTNHKGCTILKSVSPEGPFVEITNGHITPEDWNAIDGTFYVDAKGQPWLIFVKEWTCTDDGIGRMSAAKLSDDLTSFVSDPIDIFRADDPVWTNYKVTDGPFIYETKNKQLLMIWSNLDNKGNYCVGVARSKSGMIDSKWIQDEKLLFSKSMGAKHDGGHGMIFMDKNGQLYLSVHSPNVPTEGYGEKTVFIPLQEKNDTLIYALGQS